MNRARLSRGEQIFAILLLTTIPFLGAWVVHICLLGSDDDRKSGSRDLVSRRGPGTE
jgi:hypothetical protein